MEALKSHVLVQKTSQTLLITWEDFITFIWQESLKLYAVSCVYHCSLPFLFQMSSKSTLFVGKWLTHHIKSQCRVIAVNVLSIFTFLNFKVQIVAGSLTE
jgi:hypothetical protein